MLKKSVFQRKTRKFHRWFGLILGIQFFFWTIGGIYFSWSDMDQIHGDHQRAHIHPISANKPLFELQKIIDSLKTKDTVNFIFDTRLVQILNEPFYQIHYSAKHDREKKVQLADAYSGKLRGPLTKKEAIEVAKNSFKDESKIESVEYLTSTNGHHEYRENPLPAYAVTFDHPTKTTVYVSSQLGTVQKFRNNNWRVFDFLWMLHTMDYQTRDNLSNILLRAFSIFGLITILSGFLLFFLTIKKVK